MKLQATFDFLSVFHLYDAVVQYSSYLPITKYGHEIDLLPFNVLKCLLNTVIRFFVVVKIFFVRGKWTKIFFMNIYI